MIEDEKLNELFAGVTLGKKPIIQCYDLKIQMEQLNGKEIKE